MLKDKFKNILDQTLQSIPGVIGVLVIDQDGKLFYQNGRFDVSPKELGAAVAVGTSAIKITGELLKQETNSVLTEYNKMKIYQMPIGREYFLVLLLKIKDMYFGEVRNKIDKISETIYKIIITDG